MTGTNNVCNHNWLKFIHLDRCVVEEYIIYTLRCSQCLKQGFTYKEHIKSGKLELCAA